MTVLRLFAHPGEQASDIPNKKSGKDRRNTKRTLVLAGDMWYTVFSRKGGKG
jgi:hypothetical protein